MTEPHGPADEFDLDELAGYLEDLQAGVDAHVTEARLLGLRTQALKDIAPALDRPVLDDLVIHGSGTDIGRGAVVTPVSPTHPTVANPLAQKPDSRPGRPWPLPVPPIPFPPIPPSPLPAPLPVPPLPSEPVPAPPSSTPSWHEPEDGERDASARGVSKRQR